MDIDHENGSDLVSLQLNLIQFCAKGTCVRLAIEQRLALRMEDKRSCIDEQPGRQVPEENPTGLEVSEPWNVD